MILYLLNVLFTVYTFLLIVRILGSWIPSLSYKKWMQMVAFYTDPYLNLFRRFIPPLGMLDLSPMVAFFALQLIRSLLFSMVNRL